MLEQRIQEYYLRGYGAVAINDPLVSTEELGNKIIGMIPENSGDETISGSISEIIKAGVPEQGLKLINYLLAKKPEWKKALFICKITCLTLNNNLEQIIKNVHEYETAYGRDENSMAALLHAYLADGYLKHEMEIRDLIAQLKPIAEG
jgi:hypothetical protein